MSYDQTDVFVCSSAIEAWAFAFALKEQEDTRSIILYPLASSYRVLTLDTSTVQMREANIQEIIHGDKRVHVYTAHPAFPMDTGFCRDLPDGTYVYDGAGAWYIVMGRTLCTTNRHKCYPVSTDAAQRAWECVGSSLYA